MLIRVNVMVAGQRKQAGRAIRTHERCDLVMKGRLRRHVCKRGKFQSLIFRSIGVDDRNYEGGQQREPDRSRMEDSHDRTRALQTIVN